MQYNFRKDRITLLGDTHSTSITKQILETRVLDGEDVVHLGDVGLGFGNPSYSIDNALSWLDMLDRVCHKINVNLYLIPGNHDNTSPRIWNSKWANVYMIKDGDVGIFPNGKKALFLGGGISIDRYTRKEGIDYWKDEATSFLPEVEKCDILFSHDTPECFNHSSSTIPTHWTWFHERDVTLLDDCLKQRYNISDIAKRAEVKTIFYAHFHNQRSQQIDDVYARCVDINELFFFDAEHEYKI